MPFNKEKGEQEIQSEDTIFQIIFLFLSQGTYMNSEIIKSDGKWKEINYLIFLVKQPIHKSMGAHSVLVFCS